MSSAPRAETRSQANVNSPQAPSGRSPSSGSNTCSSRSRHRFCQLHPTLISSRTHRRFGNRRNEAQVELHSPLIPSTTYSQSS
ncbi:hypothetical protein PG996_009093 [Apiospora saccharicola]|uniref:Uncharacterized protein n=1 Tax=Apiospora saccharicola TaxID=335842 RepID=A0ABR1UMP3_9PEZI